MDEDKTIFDVLNDQLASESHDTEKLREQIASAESLGYTVAIRIGVLEKMIAASDRQITANRMMSLSQNNDKKVAVAEAVADDAVKDLVYTRAETEAELKYYKYVGKLIENRCSVGQSLLSNTTSQIKAGINLPVPQNSSYQSTQAAASADVRWQAT